MPRSFSFRTYMRRYIKRYLPFMVYLHNFYTNRFYQNLSIREVFQHIYDNNSWGNPESRSGEGSELAQTHELITRLPVLLRKYHLKSILDLPCGDFNWMQLVDLGGISYTGADIVEAIVEKNIEQYSDDLRIFLQSDLVSDPLDMADVIFIRDCLVHFSYDHIKKAFLNIQRAGIPYIMITTYIRSDNNYDITTGGWRKLNFEKAPFYFPPPLDIIEENCGEGAYFADKAMALWKINDLNLENGFYKSTASKTDA